MPNFAPQKASSKGIRTIDPCESFNLLKVVVISSSLSKFKAIVTLFP
jgi:hypothetical protein